MGTMLGAGGMEAGIAARRTNDFFEIPGHGGYLMSAGVGNSIAGSAADSEIIDDPFGKREDADSPVIREKIWQWYANDLYPRLSAAGWIVLTHTRWHRDDLAGRLLRKMVERGAEKWEILCLPAIKGDSSHLPGPACGRCPPEGCSAQMGTGRWPWAVTRPRLPQIRTWTH